MEQFIYLLIGYVLFVYLNFIDLLLTKVILSHPKGRELNPFMRFFFKRFGFKGMIGFKVFLIAFFGLQLVFNILDLFTIYYINFVFIVFLSMMYRDVVKSGLKDRLNLPFFYKNLLN